MKQSFYNHSLNYSVSLYLRKPVYYIRLKSEHAIYSLSLKTKHKRTAFSKLQMIKQELEQKNLIKPFNSFDELQQYFKSTISIDSHLESMLITQTNTLSTITKPTLSISQLCDDYIQEKGSHWKYATQLSAQANKTLLIEIFDYLKLFDVHNITRKDMLEVREIIKQLPVNRKQQFKYLSLKEVLQQEYDNTLSTRTINGHLIFLSSVFNWAEKNDIIKKNLATDLQLKDEKKQSDKRHAFGVIQVEQILSSCKAHSIKNNLAWQYYIPLLSAITGARLNEICQLQVKDIIKLKNDLMYIDINDDGIKGKSLKNHYSARCVPLIENAFGFNSIEFMNYVSSRGDKNNLLFDVTWTDKGRYSDKVSKWFNRTLLKQTLNDLKGLSFHSFRHTLVPY